ncbi:MAG: hypothetical protein PHO66_03645 [Eubacteriales bacterium]|nr:hypothetical protein [Eubacteriales bacterium]
MRYCENWEHISQRYLAYWARENHDRPILNIRAPRDKRVPLPASHHATLEQRWLDTQYQLD